MELFSNEEEYYENQERKNMELIECMTYAFVIIGIGTGVALLIRWILI